MQRNHPRNKIDYFLTLMVIIVSGNPAVGYFSKEVAIIVPLVILLSFAIVRRVKITHRDCVVVAMFLIIYFVHLMAFGSMTVSASLGNLARLLTALLAVRVVPDFPGKFVFVMYGLAIMSLVFFLPTLSGVDLPSLLAPMSIPLGPEIVHIGLHNFTPVYGATIVRNSGMFWEAGAFAGYLILALLFTLRSIETVPRRYFVVLVVALLSTQSTTGYLVFFIVAAALIATGTVKRFDSSRRSLAAFWLVALGVVAAAAFEMLPFLGEKIADQYHIAVAAEGRYYWTRYGNLLYDLEYIIDRPIFGWSSRYEPRQIDLDVVARQGNGLSGFTVRYGLFGLSAFCVFAFAALSDFYRSRRIAAISIIAVMVLLIGEPYLNFPMFLSLMFAFKKKLVKRRLSPIPAVD